jgi:hypothetical protein
MTTKREITQRDAEGKVLSFQFLVDGSPVPEGCKYCNSCAQVLPLTAFSPKGNNCRECATARSRAYYAKAKQDTNWREQRNTRVAQDGLEKKKKAVEYLGGKCLDCSGVFPLAVYDFHHLDPTEKEHNLGNLLRKKNFYEVEKELSKCVLLCANCHRIRHMKDVHEN